MYPIGLQEIDEEDNTAEGPGDGVCPGNGGKPVDKFYGHGDIAYPDNAPAGKHCKHRNRRFSSTPHNAGNAMGKSQQAVKQADGTHMLYAKVDSLGRFAEKANQLGRKGIADKPHQFRHQAAANNSEADTLFHPIVVTGAQVLSYKSRKRLRKAGDRQEGEALQLGIGAAACHSGFAKAVDIGLHHHIGKGNHTVLHTGGQAVLDNVHKVLFVKGNLLNTHPVGTINAQQMNQAQQGTDTLGNGGSDGGRADPKTETTHKQQIQTDVDKGGNNQVVQRMTAVADSVEDAHKNVVHHDENSAQEVIAEVADGLGQHVRGSSHPAENNRRQSNTEDCQEYAGHKTEGNGGVNGFSHRRILLGAESPGDNHTGTHRKPLEKADHHKDEAAGGAYRRQRIVANKIADTPGVKRIIQLLKNIS